MWDVRMRVNIMPKTKWLLSSIVLFSFTPLSHAQYSESELGNLFTTKQQRTKIDAARFGKPVAATIKPKVKKKTSNKKVKVSGYVTKSDGSSTVWVNGRNTLKSSRVGSVRVNKVSESNNKVVINVDGKSVRLKPGQAWTETRGVSDPVK